MICVCHFGFYCFVWRTWVTKSLQEMLKLSGVKPSSIMYVQFCARLWTECTNFVLENYFKGKCRKVGSVTVEVMWTKQCFCDTSTLFFSFNRCLYIYITILWGDKQRGEFFYIGRPKICKNKKLLFLFSKCLSLIKTPTASGWAKAFKWMYVLYIYVAICRCACAVEEVGNLILVCDIVMTFFFWKGGRGELRILKLKDVSWLE